jgi:hypothetical protein
MAKLCSQRWISIAAALVACFGLLATAEDAETFEI